LTANDTLLELPRESVALQLTEVVPSANMAPGAGEQEVGSGPSMSSTAVGDEYPTGAPFGPTASAVTTDGMLLNAGPSLSRTVTVKLAVAPLPESSEALHFTVVAPKGKRLPDEGSQLGVTLPSTASLAETENETLVPEVLVAWTLIGFGTEIEGGFVS